MGLFKDLNGLRGSTRCACMVTPRQPRIRELMVRRVLKQAEPKGHGSRLRGIDQHSTSGSEDIEKMA